MNRRDRLRRAHAQFLKVRRHDVRVQSLGLVDRERDRLARAPQLPGDVAILGGKARARIGKKDDAVALLHRLLGLGTHLRFDAAGIVDQAAGVDQHAGYGAQA